jgi:hypothetical protein
MSVTSLQFTIKKKRMSKFEEVSTNLISLGLEMMDIGEKLGKMKSTDMDAMIATAFSDSKRINSTMKKILALEEMVATLRQSITKASLKSMVVEDPVETKKEKAPAVTSMPMHLRPKVAPAKEEPKVEETKSEPKSKKVPAKEEPKVEETKSEPKSKKVPAKEEPKKEPKTKKAGGKVESESDDESTVSDTKPLHVRRKKIPKNIKTLVWNEHIGSPLKEGMCCCCKKEKIDSNNFHCGHVIAEAKGGDLTVPNLRPICPPCNSSMGTRSMQEFAKEFFGRTV